MMLRMACFLVVTADLIRQAEARVVDALRARERTCPARSIRAQAYIDQSGRKFSGDAANCLRHMTPRVYLHFCTTSRGTTLMLGMPPHIVHPQQNKKHEI